MIFVSIYATREGGDVTKMLVDYDMDIPTHAILAGGDPSIRICRMQTPNFNPRRPRRQRHPSGGGNHDVYRISTHAILAGSD